MATTPTQIRKDMTVKGQANNLFASLGMDMSGAVNIFLRRKNKLPMLLHISSFRS